MNIDEMMIIRKDDALDNPTQLFGHIRRGMNQIGKAYDFNFDISTLDKIVCSELLYVIFGNVHWPTQYRLGRPTISPDNIAEILFFKDTKFKMQSYLVAKHGRRAKQKNNINLVAQKLDYALRTSKGEPVQDLDDPTNSFWKRTTKCHLEMAESPGQYSAEGNVRVCVSTYREYIYEEHVL
jgi:hypothetical protein